VLVCFWSPKGGSGVSVVTAAAGLLVARNGGARIADLTGDQPAVLGLAREPAPGVLDWLAAGGDAPPEALDRLAAEISPGLTLLPAGDTPPSPFDPDSGAALAAALLDSGVPTFCDAGRLEYPWSQAFAEIADANVAVVRGCYLALRRAVGHPALAFTTGVVLVDEHGRSLRGRDVEDVLGVPVLATVEARATTARAVDAGVLATRMPDALGRPLRHALARLGCLEERAA